MCVMRITMSTNDGSTRIQTERIIRIGELADGLGVSRPTVWRMRERGEIPPPIRISRGIVGWRESTIDRWLAEKEAAASAEAGA